MSISSISACRRYSAPSTASQARLYLYAIIDRRPPRLELLGKGIWQRPLSLVRAGKAFVVVAPYAPREATAVALVAHERVVRRLWRLLPTVLPFRFGAIAPDAAAVRGWLAPLAESLEDAFDRVRGAAQFTLRMSGLSAPAASVDRSAGPGTRWLAQRVATHTVPELASVTEATRPFVRSVRVERRDGAPHLASVYYLVAREDVPRWRSAFVRSLDALPRGVRVTMTGPWPAWSFAELA
jgi:hypothetical protein